MPPSRMNGDRCRQSYGRRCVYEAQPAAKRGAIHQHLDRRHSGAVASDGGEAECVHGTGGQVIAHDDQILPIYARGAHGCKVEICWHDRPRERHVNRRPRSTRQRGGSVKHELGRWVLLARCRHGDRHCRKLTGLDSDRNGLYTRLAARGGRDGCGEAVLAGAERAFADEPPAAAALVRRRDQAGTFRGAVS